MKIIIMVVTCGVQELGEVPCMLYDCVFYDFLSRAFPHGPINNILQSPPFALLRAGDHRIAVLVVQLLQE